MLSRRSKLVAAAVVAVVVLGFILTISRGERSRDLVLRIEPIDPADEITVHVGGAVEQPGLFALPRGSRLAEALDQAGLLDSADTSGLPLASVLEDEQSIIVPETIAEDADTVPQTSTLTESDQPQRININQATVADLQELPGIGPALAERISERRDQDGPFLSLDELSEIAGISDRMVDEIRELATVDS
jgi:competence protein ComEA